MSEEMNQGEQTTKQAMYPQLKRSLENLIEEFRYLSLRYGSIRHEMFRTYDKERIAKESWIAFAEASGDSGKLVDEWEEWTGPDDGTFYGRFFGDGSGMDEFAALAESAFLTLCEFDPTASRSNGFHGWMNLLHDIGFKYPTSLLCSDMFVWGLDEDPDLDDFDEYTSRWLESESHTPYPKHPLCWRLTHNVFVSSIAALRIIIEPEMVLLVGHSLDDLPLPVRLPQRSTQKTVGEITTSQSIGQHEEGFWMEKQGKDYLLTFDFGDIHEKSLFLPRYGFAYIYALYCQPGKAIPVEEMKLAAGLGSGISVARSAVSQRANPEETRAVGVSENEWKERTPK